MSEKKKDKSSRGSNLWVVSTAIIFLAVAIAYLYLKNHPKVGTTLSVILIVIAVILIVGFVYKKIRS